MSNGQLHVEPRTRTLTGVQLLGTGSYVPEHVVSNADLRETHGFDPDWIVNRTGILERRFALPHQATSDLCAVAAKSKPQRCHIKRVWVTVVYRVPYAP